LTIELLNFIYICWSKQ